MRATNTLLNPGPASRVSLHCQRLFSPQGPVSLDSSASVSPARALSLSSRRLSAHPAPCVSSARCLFSSARRLLLPSLFSPASLKPASLFGPPTSLQPASLHPCGSPSHGVSFHIQPVVRHQTGHEHGAVVSSSQRVSSAPASPLQPGVSSASVPPSWHDSAPTMILEAKTSQVDGVSALRLI